MSCNDKLLEYHVLQLLHVGTWAQCRKLVPARVILGRPLKYKNHAQISSRYNHISQYNDMQQVVLVTT